MIFQEALFISLKDANKFKDESERSDIEFIKKVHKHEFREYYVKIVVLS